MFKIKKFRRFRSRLRKLSQGRWHMPRGEREFKLLGTTRARYRQANRGYIPDNWIR